MTKKLLLPLIIGTTLLANEYKLDNNQLNRIQTSYTIGQNIIANNGVSFGLALPSVQGQESSWGKHLIGDAYNKDFIESSLGDFQLQLITAKETIMKTPSLRKKYHNKVYQGDHKILKVEINHFIYLQSIVNKGYAAFRKTFVDRLTKGYKPGTLAFRHQIIISNVTSLNEFQYLHEDMKQISDMIIPLIVNYEKDVDLALELKYNPKFSAEIAGNYLRRCYNQAIKRGYKGKEIFRQAIGKYNGGWNNEKYFHGYINKEKKKINGVIDRILVVKKLIKNGIIS